MKNDEGIILNGLLETKIIAIVRGISSKYILDTVKALSEGGINAVEITFDQKDKEKYLDTAISIDLVRAHFGDKIMLGAGTVTNEETVEFAKKSGATYIISPDVNEKVIRKTKELSLISIPGAFTPTEIMTAYSYGADIVKMFPAGVMGSAYIKAVCAPINHIPVMAVGGVTPQNIKEFIKAGAVGAGVGGSLVDVSAIESGDFNKVVAIAKEFRAGLK